MTLNKNVMTTMTMIGKAIEKGAVEDIKSYLQTCDTILKESIIFRAETKRTAYSKINCSECDSFQLYQGADF